MLQSRVELVATTDDPADSLEYHRLIAQDKDFPVRVVPSFRTDAALNIRRADYPEYIRRLSDTCGFAVESIADLKRALFGTARFLLRERLPRQRYRHRGFPEGGSRAERRRSLPKGAFRGSGFRRGIPQLPV